MHNLIVGMTGSGKSTLAKMLCRRLREWSTEKTPYRTAVLDPLGDPEYAADFHTQDSDEFLRFAKANRDHYLFVDEGGESIGRYNVPMQWLATVARHCGHLCTFISQGATQLPPIVRGQCSKVFLFSCASANFQIVAEEWNENTLRNPPRLSVGEFLTVSRFQPVERGRIIFNKKLECCDLKYDKLSYEADREPDPAVDSAGGGNGRN